MPSWENNCIEDWEEKVNAVANDIATPNAAKFPKIAPKLMLEPRAIIPIPVNVKKTVTIILIVKGSFKKIRLIINT